MQRQRTCSAGQCLRTAGTGAACSLRGPCQSAAWPGWQQPSPARPCHTAGTCTGTGWWSMPRVAGAAGSSARHSACKAEGVQCTAGRTCVASPARVCSSLQRARKRRNMAPACRPAASSRLRWSMSWSPVQGTPPTSVTCGRNLSVPNLLARLSIWPASWLARGPAGWNSISQGRDGAGSSDALPPGCSQME